MSMAEGKRGRRIPEGRSAQSKVTRGVNRGSSVLQVNLDVRSGVPRATIVRRNQQQQQPQPQQQQKQHQPQQFVQGSFRTGVNGGIPVYIPSQKPHPQNNNNSSSNKNHYNNKSAYFGNSQRKPSPNIKAPRPNASSTSFQEAPDEPPKYDDIFSNHVFHLHNDQQTHKPQQKTYEKKPLKSYLLKHFPKVRTFNKLSSGHQSVNQSASFESSSTLGGGTDRGSSCYTEIHIPPPNTPNPFGEVSPHSPTTIETEGGTREYSEVSSQFCSGEVGQSPDRKYTINLKPGHYKINVQWRSKTHPFRLTLTPNRGGEGEAPPPAEEQPLYYGSCEAHQQFVNQDVETSLPRRLVHRLLFRHHSTPPLECSYNPEEEEEVLSCPVTTDMTSQLPQCQLSYQQQPQQIAPHVQQQQQVAHQQHQLLQQHVGLNPATCGDRKGQKRCWEGGPRHRQRKSRYRWASLSCMHLSSLDESIGDGSGGDSYGGYEGVEHLKRHSLGHLKAVSAESLPCGCQGKTASPAVRGFSRGLLAVDGVRGNTGRGNSNYACTNNFKYGVGGANRGRGGFLTGRGNLSRFSHVKSGVTCVDFNNKQNKPSDSILSGILDDLDEREGVTDDSFVFIEKSQLKYHDVSLRDEYRKANVTVGECKTSAKVAPSIGDRKTWHEDEAFIKQVVEEYFKEPVSLSDLEEKDSFENTKTPEKVRRAASPDTVSIGIAPKAQEESDVSSSSSSESSSTPSSSSTSSSEEDNHEFPENDPMCASPSIDDTTYCESDDTTSWYTDDSLGYEADAEPSDKDTLGHVWRRWRSAPDMRQTGDSRMRRVHQLGKLAGAAAAAAASRQTGCKESAGGADRGETKTSPPWRRDGVSGGARRANDDGVGHRRVERKSTQLSSSAFPYKSTPVFGYQPRKSCSVDETKLSRLKFGVRKVKKHKLLQFNHQDPGRRSKPAHLVSANKKIDKDAGKDSGNNNENNSTKGEAKRFDTSSRDLSLQEEDEFNGMEKLEFVNGKYKASLIDDISARNDINLCGCLQEIKKVDIRERIGCSGVVGGEKAVGVGGGSGCCTSVEGGSIDDSTAERTEKVLTQGLVIHHSNAKHDHHAILNPSVIKNALSILREGITADPAQEPKSVLSTERGVVVPNEPPLTQRDDDKVGEEENLKLNQDFSEPSVRDIGNNFPYNETRSYQEENKVLVDQVSGFDCEKNIEREEYSEELGDMNRTNITIQLTPPATNRKLLNRTDVTRSKESVELPLNISVTLESDIKGIESATHVDGGLSPLKKDATSRSERTYENIDHQGRPSFKDNFSSRRKSQEGSKGNDLDVPRVKLRGSSEVGGHGKRSASVDSFRKSDMNSVSRASTVSSSSETSSCCHARPKSKPKSSKCQSRGNSYSRGNDSIKNSQVELKESRASSSTSGQVLFGNEYHVQRIQVGTGDSRKFAQTTQRAVLEVPVCGNESSESQLKKVQKSELVLEPSHSRRSTLKASSSSKHSKPPTFVSASFPKSSLERTCISEYNIGDAQPRRRTPDTYGPLAEEFKENRTEDKSETSSSKHGRDADGGKKSKKSSSKGKSRATPIKYFSGILHAFGSAAPRFRSGLTNVPGNECEGNKYQERRSRGEDGSRGSRLQREKETCKGGSNITERDKIPSIVPLSLPSESEHSRIKTTRTAALLGDGRGKAAGTRIGDDCGEESVLTPITKIDQLQVLDTKNNRPAGTECSSPAVSDAVVPPVPSPRPRRALKNSHESAAGNIAPTPPTRRKNFPEPSAKPLVNGPLIESSGVWACGGGEEGDRSHESTWHSPKASPSARRLAEGLSHSGEKRRTRSQSSHPSLNPSEVSTKESKSSLTRELKEVDNLPYENISFHEKHSFGLNDRRDSGTLKRDTSNSSHLNTSKSQSDHKRYRKRSKDRDKRNSKIEKRKSIKSEAHRRSLSLHSQTNELPCKSCASNNGSTASNTCSGGGGGGGGGGGSGSQSYGGGSGEMDGNRNNSKESVSGGGGGSSSGWRNSGGGKSGGGSGMDGAYNPGGSGGESSGGASGRRRRVRPPSLPTSPLQSSRPRRPSQTSQTSGGSLPSSPTRWRRPQFEDTWDGVCDDGGRDYRRLSRTPSAESMESEATSFYYSAMGSAVYDEPKSVYEDVSARYSFVTCPQYEPAEDHQATSSVLSSAKPPGGSNTTVSNNIPRTISGDLNCDVDVSLSEGEIKVRVRTEDEEVTSSTPIHEGDTDDSDESDDECDSDDSDGSHEYELSKSYRSRDYSPDDPYSESETDGSDEADDDRAETLVTEVKVIGTGIVHAVPCMAGTDSSNFSTLSSSFERGCENESGCKKENIRPPKSSGGPRESVVHATPCWATTDSDVRSSVSSADYYSKVCLSVSRKEKLYEPQYENVNSIHEREKAEEKSSAPSSETESQKRRLSGVWTTVEESDDESSEWEDETLPANLRKSFSKASIGEGEEEEEEAVESEQVRCPPAEEDDEGENLTHSYSTVDQEDLRNNCISPRPASPFSTQHQRNPIWSDPSVGNNFQGVPLPNAREGWDQREANAWEWHRAVWEHHKQIHEQHLQHVHQQQHHHQSLLADVMSCLGGTRWGMNASNWCHHSYADTASCGRDEGRFPHLHDCPTPDCRWSGQFHEDPPYQPAGATSPGDLGKPPPSPLPPSGSHRSRDTSSVPRDGARPQSRQRSRSRRRAHSANSKYQVELEIPPHLLDRQRPSSFGSLAARKPSSPSPEPLVDDLHQEALLYLADTSFDHTADANRRR